MERFARHFPKGRDVTLVILKGHLLIEEELNDLLTVTVPRPEHLFSARLTFLQRLRLAQAMYPTEGIDRLAPAIEILNSARNKLAHQLEPKALASTLAEFIELAFWTGSNRSRKPTSPFPSTYTLTALKQALALTLGVLSHLRDTAASATGGKGAV
jgi:hypothetical protein